MFQAIQSSRSQAAATVRFKLVFICYGLQWINERGLQTLRKYAWVNIGK